MAKNTSTTLTLMWFRDDLRISDNPAFHEAATRGCVLPIYLWDERSDGLRALGGASRWWLHYSLASLAERLTSVGCPLHIVRGAAAEVIPAIAAASGAVACVWNRRYGQAERAVDTAVTTRLQGMNIETKTFNGTLLHEPGEVTPKAGGSFKVYTPFLRASLALGPPGHPLAAPKTITAHDGPLELPGKTSLEGLGLLPTAPDWSAGLRDTWQPGEPQAQKLLHGFLEGGLRRYGEDRNRPALPASSRLSPHLRFGEISPRQIVTLARHAGADGTASGEQVEKFVSEVIWRDFAYLLLTSHPDLADKPFNAAFEKFPYAKASPTHLRAWQTGQTGYPIVDAGMRQLWKTGVMHNRVRMITASFLVKHLLLDWRLGEQWFWDTLCDADPASNPFNWQWVAGSGADAAPYFRIFNPTLQGEKFDPDGDYVRSFVPELTRLPARWIHTPWAAPRDVLAAAGITLGKTYPQPIVDHDAARLRALAALADMRQAEQAEA
ncbi:cryptochrome/photolyase family protein [Lichenihabitans psoromatis]|uniref:cryptochrome/photolyase family protein n=1 Tax=Lichenihabitans psoromatis TaxID=2528642 RepID=UPI001035B7C4|nr:deoxyribodipyrimidine photo-lyase [Lichenihabitans psoromatis]